MSVRQLIIFNLNEEDFGIEITQVKEIIKLQDIFKIPNTPNFIEGLINLRGKVHTVFNLRKKFNLPALEYDDNTKIIIVNVDSTTVGFIVDSVNEIIRIDEENIEDTPKSLVTLNKEYVNGVVKIDDRIILMLDLSQVLTLADEAEIQQV